MKNLKFIFLLLTFCLHVLNGEDWPTYQKDSRRGGYTSESLPKELSLAWSLKFQHKPTPSWPRNGRVTYDKCFQPVVKGDLLYVGSSVTGKVLAIELKSGKEIWSFYTQGPVRLAPYLWKDKIFITSDDGYLYALNAKTGALLWKHRGGPTNEKVLGNNYLISKWPARGGVAIDDDRLYYAAGIWPSDGIYVYALNPDSGKVIWENTKSGSIRMAQPHSNAKAVSGISAQGYFVTYKSRLFIPTGRAVPAVMDKSTGKLKYFYLSKFGKNGGSNIVSNRNLFFNNGYFYYSSNGNRSRNFPKSKFNLIAITPQGLVGSTSSGLSCHLLLNKDVKNKKGKLVKKYYWEKSWSLKKKKSSCLIVAKDQIISGSLGQITRVDRNTRLIINKLKIKGQPYGLVAANGYLIVSTDKGELYCFGKKTSSPPVQHIENDLSNIKIIPTTQAKEIVKVSKVEKGYGLVFGCANSVFIHELTTFTKLKLVVVDTDMKLVDQCQKDMSRWGLLGSRVTVLHVKDYQATGLPDYFANIIIGQEEVLSKSKYAHNLRPYGGVLISIKKKKLNVTVRGELKGAGNWSHQYADAGNTLCSQDELATGNFGILWYKEINFDLISRHGRSPAPLCIDGTILYGGLHGVIACDAYNGTELWRFKITNFLKAYHGGHLVGTSGTGGMYCGNKDYFYVRNKSKCYQLDYKTGRVVNTFQLPNKKDSWAYIAYQNGVLFGSTADNKHIVTYRYQNTGNLKAQFTESKNIFAYDIKSGKLLWNHKAINSIRNNAIAISEKKIFFIDRPKAAFDKKKRKRGVKLTAKQKPGVLYCLDSNSGKLLWKNEKDIYGTTLIIGSKKKQLLMSYQPSRHRLDSEKSNAMSAFSSETGQQNWKAITNYSTRPLLIDDSIYTNKTSLSYETGKELKLNFPRSYGCGVLSSSKSSLFFRSATLGYFNINKDKKIKNYGGVRPGCWINVIPAGGIVLMPDSTSFCRCSYLNQTWLALQNKGPKK